MRLFSLHKHVVQNHSGDHGSHLQQKLVQNFGALRREIDRIVQAEHNAFLMCDNFEKPSWVELLPTEGPDSDAPHPKAVRQGTTAGALAPVLGRQPPFRDSMAQARETDAFPPSARLSSEDSSCPEQASFTGIVFFLHEWRRCVCRCTSHLSRVKKELLDRLHTTRKDQSNPTPTKKQHNKTQNVQPAAQLREPRRHEEGETGAMNSAKRSVLLVPRIGARCNRIRGMEPSEQPVACAVASTALPFITQ